MKTRKLIPLNHLLEFQRLKQLGVPIRKIIRDNDLNISGPHLSKLIDYYTLGKALDEESQELLTNSLFPDWLNADLPVQEQPEDYKYNGIYPYGTWENVSGNN